MRAYFALASVALLACSSAAGPADTGSGGAAGASGAGNAGTAGAAGSAGTGGSLGGGAGGTGGTLASGGTTASGECTSIGTSEVFGHSAKTLYRIDPGTKDVKQVADFSGCDGSVIDIALDKTGAMFGTTFTSVAKIDKSNAKCTTIGSGAYPNSLSFVPAGTLLPNEEALVGYEDAAYVRIDTATGKKSTINANALKGGLISSGDIVSVIGGGTYLTVKGGNCDPLDCVIQVDPKTGEQLKLIGSAGYGDVFGLAYWSGFVYGATKAGDLFTFDLNTMKPTALTIPNKPSGLSFFGAGSTTCAPIGDIK